MASPRAVTVIVLLLFPAASTAQPASVRTAVPLPIPAATLAAAVGSHTVDRSRVLLDVVRIVFDAPDAPASASGKLRARVNDLLRTVPSGSTDTVPLPLTPDIWRDAILQMPIPDAQLIATIFGNRQAALMYYGLSALDDETLRWLAIDLDPLLHIRKHPGAFAAFGRSFRVHDGRVAVPGGPAAESLWQAAVGGDPANPVEFVRALFRFDRGRAAFLYDTVAHLDAAHQQFVLNRHLDALLSVFRHYARDWDVETRPFARPQLDPALLLLTIRVDARGNPTAPAGRGLWERVFRDDLNPDVPFKEVAAWASMARDSSVDAAWLAKQIHLAPYPVARRRLDTLLFAQRVLGHQPTEPHVSASVLRAFMSMPALMLTLERTAVTDAALFVEAARRAHALNGIGNDTLRQLSVTLFQVAVGVIERGTRSRALPPVAARSLLDSLMAIPVDGGRGYDDRVAAWIRKELFNAAARSAVASSDPVEEAVLSLLAGATNGRPAPVVEWEGVKYRVDPAAAELTRLRRVRQRQEGLSLDAAIAQLLDRRSNARGREDAQRDLREVLTSVLYAAHLGDPEGAALAAGNVALRHDFGFTSARPGVTPTTAWRVPVETFGQASGWRIQGSLLGLDAGLRRLALRRLDSGQLPTGPKLPILERNTAILTAALMNPHALTDEGRDRVSAALARGRGRVAALRGDASLAADVAHQAGLSEWRREALRWALLHASDETDRAFSLVELFWLGADASDLNAFGAAPLALTGCLCLEMPAALAWENLAGRPSAGLLASLGVDVTLRLTEALSERKLPAALLAGVLAYAMLDVVDEADPAYFDDWAAFSRTAAAIDGGRIDDYIAALTADGPLIPASRGTQ
jgi:hypothetical protein